MNYIETVEKEIREDWFKDHVATVRQDGLATVIDWEKPGTTFYWVRYILVGSVVAITGDLGNAMFRLTEIAELSKLKNYNLGYFMKKMVANEGERWNFDEEKAEKELKERLEDRSYGETEEQIAALKGIVEDMRAVIKY